MAITGRLKRALGLALAGPVCGLAISACGSAGSQGRIADASSRTYSDPAGWAIRVPPRWRVTRFMNSRGATALAGAVISNVRLSTPDSVPGYPIQINGRALPRGGIGLVIANDPSRGGTRPPSPPLPSPDAGGDQWSIGSAPTGSPYLETLESAWAGKTFVASAKSVLMCQEPTFAPSHSDHLASLAVNEYRLARRFGSPSANVASPCRPSSHAVGAAALFGRRPGAGARAPAGPANDAPAGS